MFTRDEVLQNLLEVKLDDPENFLKIRETLNRIGIASFKTKTIYPSCHILHKRGRYYIVSFLELFALDGKPCTMTQEDVERRNRIALLLEEWGLCRIVAKEGLLFADMKKINIIKHKDLPNWTVIHKYQMLSDRKS